MLGIFKDKDKEEKDSVINSLSTMLQLLEKESEAAS